MSASHSSHNSAAAKKKVSSKGSKAPKQTIHLAQPLTEFTIPQHQWKLPKGKLLDMRTIFSYGASERLEYIGCTYLQISVWGTSRQ